MRLLKNMVLSLLTMWLFFAVSFPRRTSGQDMHGGHLSREQFGTVQFQISCSPESQRQFDRAVAMLHSFFYPETIKAFQAIADREPSCAMAYWGVAISQRPNPLAPPFSKTVLARGWSAIQQAQRVKAPTQRERDWIEALALFFKDFEKISQKNRTELYSNAMARLHQRYPNDSEAAIFYALSLLEAVDLMDKTYSRQLQAAAILERLQKSHPDHPGIIHYLIHSYDFAPIARRGLPAARRYAALAPSAPHALHMPSHIFTTLGMWEDAIKSNLAADAATLEYARRVNPSLEVNSAAVADRYHALDFLTYAYLQLAQDKRAKEIVDLRNSIAGIPAESRISLHTAFAAIPVRYALERQAWEEAARIPPVKTPYKEAAAIIWFGRALGAARSGNIEQASNDLRQLSLVHEEIAATGDPYWAEQTGIEESAAKAWIAFAQGRKVEAERLMNDAADREDRTEKHVAMENRLSPMRELLGDMFLEENKAADALREFRSELQVTPNRFRSLAGAARAAELIGDRKLEAFYNKMLVTLTSEADTERPAVQKAREFFANGNH